MGNLIFKNNAQSTITGIVGPTASQVTVQLGTGSLFASPQPGQHFVATFVDAETGLSNEIVWVTQVTADTMTIVRGQEGTDAKAWNPGDSFAELWTAGQAATMLQQGDEQAGTSTFGLDTGVANAYSVVLNPALTTNTMGMALRFKAANSNTSSATINFGPGAAPLLNAQGQPLSGGEISAGFVYEVYWHGAGYNMALPGLAQAIPVGMIAPFAGGVVPGGWLACVGQIVNVSAFPGLFGVIGNQYGGSLGSTFGIPDLRGRVPAGLDGGTNRLTNTRITAGGGSNTLGGNGGQESETASVVVGGLGVSGGPAYGYGGLSGYAQGTLRVFNYHTDAPGGDADAYLRNITTTGGSIATQYHWHAIDTAWGVTPGGTGGGYNILSLVSGNFNGRIDAGSAATSASTTNVQPTIMLQYMIKT